MATTRNNRGFISLEALVAFAVLTMMLAAVYQVFTNTYMAVGRITFKDLVLAEAQSLVETVGITTPVDVGTRTGTFSSGAGWTLTTRAIKPNTNENNDGLKRYWVKLVAYDSKNREILDLATIIISGKAK